MYKIYLQDGDNWVFVEDSSLTLENTLTRVSNLTAENLGSIYRIEEINELGQKIINVE